MTAPFLKMKIFIQRSHGYEKFMKVRMSVCRVVFLDKKESIENLQ